MQETLLLHTWSIKCNHTAEIIDRILMIFRKRGMTIEKMSYYKLSDDEAICEVSFEETEANAGRIFKNMERTVDVSEIIIN